jgi:Cupin domain.
MEITDIDHVKDIDVISRNGLTRKLIIGPSIDSNEIVLRIMNLDRGCATPLHSHPFPHIWKIEKGQGLLVDQNNREVSVIAGNYIFIKSNEPHSLRNNSENNLEYLCFGTIDSENIKPCLIK